VLTPTVNLGILAHVDAGKTSLTERLLYDNGAIAELGSVDAGSTATDTGELERERGITIRSAVASFATDELRVNLVDTPGHPDFIAEVERALSVLDGAVLVLSAVEGVQAQTRVLMRSLRKLRLPTLIFANKIDRLGARHGSLLADIRAKLAPHVVPMSADPLARAEILAEHDDALLARLVAGAAPEPKELHDILRRQTADGLVHPVFFGSALTGQGVGELTEGIRTLLRPPTPPKSGPHGTVFAIERAAGGEKVAYLRLFSGELRARQRVTFHRQEGEYTGRITGLEVIGDPGERVLRAGSIAKLRGLPRIRVGDQLGTAAMTEVVRFSPPSLETVVRPAEPGQQGRVHAALTSLADEDPLIRARTADDGATSVLLYGAVQREVIAARLRRDFGVDAVFEQIKPVYFERPVGVGESTTEFDRRAANEFWATVGLRVESAPVGSGVSFTRDVEWGALPRAFHRAIEEAALRALDRGLYGWEVTDCAITVMRIGYEAPMSVAADFRNLTPIVLMRALRKAGTRVYEPCQSLEIEVPADVAPAVIGYLNGLGADITNSEQQGASWLVSGELPVRLVQEFTMALPGLSHGEGAVWSRPGTDRPVRGAIPTRNAVRPSGV
jgi:ribosomal protection tetracycline resistance protein